VNISINATAQDLTTVTEEPFTTETTELVTGTNESYATMLSEATPTTVSTGQSTTTSQENIPGIDLNITWFSLISSKNGNDSLRNETLSVIGDVHLVTLLPLTAGVTYNISVSDIVGRFVAAHVNCTVGT